MADGRIHPARIEEMVEKSRKEVDERIREYGEQATFEVGVHGLHPDLIKILGRLKFRTSYGQNVLKHSMEVAYLTGLMAGELVKTSCLRNGQDCCMTSGKRWIMKWKDRTLKSAWSWRRSIRNIRWLSTALPLITVIVKQLRLLPCWLALTHCLARPGARRETLETYIRRLEKLEEISESFEGVEKSYAIQAGREVRVMVQPEKIDDAEAFRLARDITKTIENELDYPGHIKVTVIRETRAVDYAK